MKTLNSKTEKRTRRHTKIRMRVTGTAVKPRLAVFRSNAFIYAQLIDDEAGKTLASANDVKLSKGTKTERANEVGETLAKEAKAKKISTVVFDRGGFIYAGRVKACADAARKGGLQF